MKIKMKEYGVVLTGRAFGKEVYGQILQTISSEKVDVDFSGVFSLGSSFGEEIIVPLAKRQQNKIDALVTSAAVKDCLEQISKDYKIKIDIHEGP